MPDHARSDHPAVQAQLDRLWGLSPGADILGLERITTLLGRLGDPQHHLPPVFHVAGTNGKGSTCAFLRAAVEASGQNVHVYSSPHLVRFNERIRIAGALIDDARLAALLAEVLDVAHDLQASFFEVTTAAAFLAFARTPADACIVEVGLGGRLDATNIMAAPTVCGIASLGIDHEAFLLAPEADVPTVPHDRIAFEKAGIAKPGAPLVTQAYPASMRAVIAARAAAVGAPLVDRGAAWNADIADGRLNYRDARGTLDLPLPAMAGAHQADNAALAIAMLRHQAAVSVDDAALAAAMTRATWPARMQRLGAGPLTALLPPGTAVWLDGGHNPDAGVALAAALRDMPPLHIVCGLLANKDAMGFLRPFADRIASFRAVPIPGHDHHAPKDLCQRLQDGLGIVDARACDNVLAALRQLADAPGDVLICGSLYLAGEVLAANGEFPD